MTPYLIVDFPGGTSGASGANNKLPSFEYTGEYALVEDGAGWKIRFLTSGTLFMKEDRAVDIFAVGGGGNGGGAPYAYAVGGAGGGGGYTTTVRNTQLTAGTYYEIVVGSGGSGYNVSGGTSSFAEICQANGGAYGTSTKGGNGGSGGGGRHMTSNQGPGLFAGAGGSDGSNGDDGTSGSTNSVGIGQGTTTKEFGEATGTLYAGGGGTGRGTQSSAIGLGGAGGGGDGGGSGQVGNPGEDNTGGGGGGGCNGTETGGAGGSGIVIIRNTHYAVVS